MSDQKRARLSRRLIAAIVLAGQPAYRIAIRAGLHPSTLSQLKNGIIPVKPNDPRVLRVARIVGVTAKDAFE